MKIDPNISFSKQLIIYLMIVLLIAFICISLVLTNSLQQFIKNNAYTQAKTIASNVLVIFEREILKIEEISNNIINQQDKLEYEKISGLPVQILKSYSMLIGSSIHYDSHRIEGSERAHITAFRGENGKIELIDSTMHCDFCHFDTTQIIRRNQQNGYWIYSQVYNNQTIAYCQPIYNRFHRPICILKIDFPLKTITDFLCNYDLFKSGYLFIVDNQGRYVAHPNSKMINTPMAYNRYNTHNFRHINKKIINGETGESYIVLNNTKHYLYFTPIQAMNWRMGIICPYNEILNSTNKLYLLLFICLGVGLLALFIGIIKIVHTVSSPLEQLADSTRCIAEGQFNVKLPILKANQEINELYEAFKYMQQNLIKYLEFLRIKTVEKEQMSTEMSVASRVQERFLSKDIVLPKNIKLAAKLSQCKKIGGDLYEYFIKDNQLYFVIGDVAGKGIPAALYMASICKLFCYVANQNASTAAICDVINKYMCENADDDMYITMFVGRLDLSTCVMTFTNAGHPYPLIISKKEKCYFLDEFPNIAIGIFKGFKFNEQTYTIRKNTTLLWYTDGVTNAENTKGIFYGQNNMIKCIKDAENDTPDVIIQTLLYNLQNHIGDREQSDDLTILCLRCEDITKM
ncbi:MAG: SpoIIE family protein phosphatase [Odoribacter sp.]